MLFSFSITKIQKIIETTKFIYKKSTDFYVSGFHIAHRHRPISDSHILVANLVDVPHQRTIVVCVIFVIPDIVPVSFNDFFWTDSSVFLDFEFVSRIVKKSQDTRTVPNGVSLDSNLYFNGNMWNTISIDCIVEVGLIENVIILIKNSLIFYSQLFEVLCQNICGITTTSTKKVVVINILIDLFTEFIDKCKFLDDVHNCCVYFQYKDTTIFWNHKFFLHFFIKNLHCDVTSEWR